MKIGIVGDLHIAPVPSNRIDDYFQTGLNKIEEISQVCDKIIFLGDIFTNAKVEEIYTNTLMEHLFYCKSKYNVDFYTIIGNHDVVHEDENNLNNSSLGILKTSRIMNIITPDNPMLIGDYNFNTIPVNFKKAKEYLINKVYTKNDILLVHHEYETGTNCFTYDDFKNLNCHSIYLGHDHKPFDQGRIIYPEFTIYRSGSIMRNRAEDYNFTRCVYYYILENNNVSCQAIKYESADKVFRAEAITKQNYKKEKFIEALDKVIDKYKSNISTQSRFSIKTILEEMNAPEKVIEGVRKKYEKLGETFN